MDSTVAPSPFAQKHSNLRLGAASHKRTLQARLSSLFFFLYRLVVGPALRAFGGLGHECKFYPSCSHYTEQAFAELPAHQAFLYSMRRLGRCNPWTKSFGFDPVPQLKLLES